MDFDCYPLNSSMDNKSSEQISPMTIPKMARPSPCFSGCLRMSTTAKMLSSHGLFLLDRRSSADKVQMFLTGSSLHRRKYQGAILTPLRRFCQDPTKPCRCSNLSNLWCPFLSQWRYSRRFLET